MPANTGERLLPADGDSPKGAIPGFLDDDDFDMDDFGGTTSFVTSKNGARAAKASPAFTGASGASSGAMKNPGGASSSSVFRPPKSSAAGSSFPPAAAAARSSRSGPYGGASILEEFEFGRSGYGRGGGTSSSRGLAGEGEASSSSLGGGGPSAGPPPLGSIYGGSLRAKPRWGGYGPAVDAYGFVQDGQQDGLDDEGVGSRPRQAGGSDLPGDLQSWARNLPDDFGDTQTFRRPKKELQKTKNSIFANGTEWAEGVPVMGLRSRATQLFPGEFIGHKKDKASAGAGGAKDKEPPKKAAQQEQTSERDLRLYEDKKTSRAVADKEASDKKAQIKKGNDSKTENASGEEDPGNDSSLEPEEDLPHDPLNEHDDYIAKSEFPHLDESEFLRKLRF